MALLSEDKRKEYFKALGLGEYNKANIKALQKKYMARKSDADGIYGQNTDNLLRHLYNCHKYLNPDNFRPEEFKCECGGKYCCGYPTFMKPAQLTNLQAIRSHYGKPMQITSGMRCRGWNSHCGGSISNSKHLIGQATDFYMQGVTDTLANRKAFINYAVRLPNTTYIYGNGCNGYMDSGKWKYGSVSAPYMGNAIHYDTSDGNPVSATITEAKGTSKVTSSKYKVIDVSEWQGEIDWKKVKADGVVGAIIRYADGTYLDPNFATNMKNAKANGLHVGAYIFSRAKTKADAEKEATRLFNACKPYAPDMPMYIDLEAKGLEKYADTVAQAYLAKMKALGGYGGVYANYNWWTNYLKKTAKGSFAMWLAQYNKTMDYKPKTDVGMWQYSSSGSVKGISTRVDMNHCYVAYWDKIKPTPKPTPTPPQKQGYQGTFPTLRLKKSNAEVIADAVTWAKKIASNNDFHYGYGKHSHHNGCYYCGTQPASKKNSGIKMWETTYCCNPFVHAAWAHGGCVPKALEICQKGGSWGFAPNDSPSYEKSTLFTKLGKPPKSELKVGDVLCASHVALYIGNGKVVQAGHSDDNVIGSSKWNSSINVSTWGGWTRAYRYNGSIDRDMPIRHGEYSDRVADLQRFLIWYGYKISVTNFFNHATLEAVLKFQEAELGKKEADGIVGPKTIDAMKKVKK